MNFYKTKYYPVNIREGVIYNDPQTRERDCSFLSSRKYQGMGTIGIKGQRLITFPRYRQFTVLEKDKT